MENIGDWLYIILMGLAVVVSLINAAKKKKPETPEPDLPYPDEETVEGTTSSGRSFQDVLREIQEQEYARQQEVRRQQQAREARQQAAQAAKKAPSPFLSGEKITSSAKRPATPIVEEPIIPPLVTTESFNDPEELRKAVIYAEILNRKY